MSLSVCHFQPSHNTLYSPTGTQHFNSPFKLLNVCWSAWDSRARGTYCAECKRASTMSPTKSTSLSSTRAWPFSYVSVTITVESAGEQDANNHPPLQELNYGMMPSQTRCKLAVHAKFVCMNRRNDTKEAHSRTASASRAAARTTMKS